MYCLSFRQSVLCVSFLFIIVVWFVKLQSANSFEVDGIEWSVYRSYDSSDLSTEQLAALRLLNNLVGDLISFWHGEIGREMFRIFSVPGVVNLLKRELTRNTYGAWDEYAEKNPFEALFCEAVVIHKNYVYTTPIPDFSDPIFKSSVTLMDVSMRIKLTAFFHSDSLWRLPGRATKKLVCDVIDILKRTTVNNWLIQDQARRALAEMFQFLMFASLSGYVHGLFVLLFTKTDLDELHQIANCVVTVKS